MPSPARSVFLDANVLFSITLTDVFLSSHDAKLIDISYSSYVEEEALRHLRRLTASDPERWQSIERRFRVMRTYSDSLKQPLRVESRARTTFDFEIADPDDRQVVQDALDHHCHVLVTADKALLSESLEGLPLRARHPDDLLASYFETDTAAMRRVLSTVCARKRRPPISPAQLADRLARAGAPTFAAQVRRADL